MPLNEDDELLWSARCGAKRALKFILFRVVTWAYENPNRQKESGGVFNLGGFDARATSAKQDP